MSQMLKSNNDKHPRLQLLSVAFNEASIDTPSFRAYVNYYHTKVELLEDWMDTTNSYVEQKFKPSYSDFYRSLEVLIETMLPPPKLLNNGFVANQSFASRIIYDFDFAYSEFIKRICSIINPDDNKYSDGLLNLLTTAIRPYRTRRKNFEYYQAKYDSMLTQLHSATTSSKTLEPSYLREEANRTFEIRRSYLDASLNLVSSISTLRLSVDKFLANAIGRINQKNVFTFNENGKQINLAPTIHHYFHYYYSWLKSSVKSSKTIDDTVFQAQEQVYNQMLKQLLPSTDENQYLLKNIDSILSSTDCLVGTYPQKSGWLYMRTTVGSSDREIWVRRWCFLNDMIFGMFALSPSKTYVEETDKFGIGLINVRYFPDISRRFCFQLEIDNGKGKELIIVTLQAESVTELREWVHIMLQSKLKFNGLIKDEKDKANYNYANKRYSPQFYEFASSATTSMDQKLTSFDRNSSSLIECLRSVLAPDQVRDIIDERTFLFKIVTSPISTKLTPLAMLSGSFRYKNRKYYDGIQANIWGLNIWNQNGGISINDKEAAFLKQHLNNPLIIPDKYPKNYLNDLKIQNMQFKTIFESINYDASSKYTNCIDELLLFKISTVWTANEAQMFPSITYVTRSYLYLYMSVSGFLHFSRRKFDDFISIENDPTTPHLIKMHTHHNYHIKIYTYFEDSEAVARKMQYLVELNASHGNKSTGEILDKFNEIDDAFKQKSEKEELINDPATNKLIKAEYELGKTFWNINSTSKELVDRCKNIRQHYTKTYIQRFEIASKGLMHIIYGDTSNVFPNSYFLAARNANFNTNWYWTEERDSNGIIQLVRKIDCKMSKTDNFLFENSDKVCTSQRIIKMVENTYYEVDQDPILIKIPFCRPLKVSSKYVITELFDAENSTNSELKLSTNGSELYANYKIEFVGGNNESFIEDLIKRCVVRFSQIEHSKVKSSIDYYLDRIGKHGKVVKAIKLCGLLGVLAGDGVIQNNENLNDKESLDNFKWEGIPDTSSERSANERASVRSEAEKEKVKKTDLQSVSDGNVLCVKYTFALLIRVIMKLTVFRLINFILISFRIVMMGFTFIGTLLSQVNKTLLLGLILSIFYNIFVSARSGISYWSVRKADNFFKDIMSDKNSQKVERALYIKDIDLLTDYLVSPDDDEVLKNFNNDLTSNENKYRESRRELALKRNDLLVELKILQNMEKELVQGDYKSFLIKETENCKKAQLHYEHIWEQDKQLQSYCERCSTELQRLVPGLL
ncbi:hypothetical protein KAFR_0A08490 [Kazachstania africana CBS 2517]|uniref:PH domain-containing protein n=1 Tax=Kazachstania africana (strain ATCC 22294 / BCRC 22015 / CBS 2517 / CECT 1963 / NBRC 1671 / NRRL Y-8276) TaxID=1071382 RepID=H2API3_KAZAF|nr:hypothetical protein KAFR_0A08490 [Kazachstania africana CBS 2517]CCF56283.1 hypothetical protein KAFR_0A08490 [Kazachstania africana CBS 2517]